MRRGRRGWRAGRPRAARDRSRRAPAGGRPGRRAPGGGVVVGHAWRWPWWSTLESLRRDAVDEEALEDDEEHEDRHEREERRGDRGAVVARRGLVVVEAQGDRQRVVLGAGEVDERGEEV